MSKFTAWWAENKSLVFFVFLGLFVYLFAKHQAREATHEGIMQGMRFQQEVHEELLKQREKELQKKREP